MACSGSYCNAFGTGTTTCNQHRGTCAVNRVLSAAEPTVGSRINRSDIENLRASIMDEIDAYNAWQVANSQPAYTKFDPGAFSTGQIIDNSHINNLNSTVANLNDPGITRADGSLIDEAGWQAIFDKYNVVRQDCICNSDCSCNNVCACHNDCGCNYSDTRLKENIQFIDKTNGVNVYSWNYTWNKTRTYVGVLAQEILTTDYADAVTTDSNGFYMVDYKKLPI